MSEKQVLFSRPLPIAVFIALALAADQLIKYLVEAYLPFNEAVPVVPMLALYRTYNYGVAFSMLSGMEGWFIVGMRLTVVAFVLWLWRRTPKDRFFAHFGYALIIAGALGNLVDRLIFGYVIDYILFPRRHGPSPSSTWPIVSSPLAPARSFSTSCCRRKRSTLKILSMR